jgi:hypothetical protein
MLPLKAPESLVAVWATVSLLVHVTDEPALIVTEPGVNSELPGDWAFLAIVTGVPLSFMPGVVGPE